MSRGRGRPLGAARGRAFGVRVRQLALGGVLLALSSACATGRGAVVSEPVAFTSAMAWDSTQLRAEQLVAAGRYAAADSVLQRFETRYAGTDESGEALYWRALLAIDPANPGSSPRAALRVIDHYLARGAAQPHYAQALMLRRTAEAIDALQRQAVTTEAAPAPPATDAAAAERARLQAEITRLRQELDRTQAELERLRQRVRPR